jgi:hypothetical protein
MATATANPARCGWLSRGLVSPQVKRCCKRSGAGNHYLLRVILRSGWATASNSANRKGLTPENRGMSYIKPALLPGRREHVRRGAKLYVLNETDICP